VVVEIISLCETALLEELYDSGETKERQRKPKVQSGMDNLETRATLGINHRTKTYKTKTQHRKVNSATLTSLKNRGQPKSLEG
jgi:phage-related protein